MTVPRACPRRGCGPSRGHRTRSGTAASHDSSLGGPSAACRCLLSKVDRSRPVTHRPLPRLHQGGHSRTPADFSGWPPAAPVDSGSVVSGDAHVCACVLRREARDYAQCDAPRFCGIPSKWNVERQPTRAAGKKFAALTSIGLGECDESLHLARGPNFDFHARSIRPCLRDGRRRFRGHS